MPRKGVSTAVVIAVFIVGLLIGAGLVYVFAPSLGITTATQTNNITTVVTTTPAIPANITLSGSVRTVGIGTAVTKLYFISQNTPTSYQATISDGTYSVTLPNSDAYTAKITYSVLGTINNQTCLAGTAPLYFQFEPSSPVTWNWSC